MAHVANLYLDGQLIAEKAVVSWNQDVLKMGELHLKAKTAVHPGTHYELAFADGGIVTIVFPSTPAPAQDDGWRKFKPIHWVFKP